MTWHTIAFDVMGKPEPQGSAKAFVVAGRARITSDNNGLHFWRNTIADAARKRMEGLPLADKGVALVVKAEYRLSRPKSAPKRVIHQTTKPDLDKLIRATLDALTEVVWRDDAQVVRISASKGYAALGEQPGARVVVQVLP